MALQWWSLPFGLFITEFCSLITADNVSIWVMWSSLSANRASIRLINDFFCVSSSSISICKQSTSAGPTAFTRCMVRRSDDVEVVHWIIEVNNNTLKVWESSISQRIQPFQRKYSVSGSFEHFSNKIQESKAKRSQYTVHSIVRTAGSRILTFWCIQMILIWFGGLRVLLQRGQRLLFFDGQRSPEFEHFGHCLDHLGHKSLFMESVGQYNLAVFIRTLQQSGSKHNGDILESHLSSRLIGFLNKILQKSYSRLFKKSISKGCSDLRTDYVLNVRSSLRRQQVE